MKVEMSSCFQSLSSKPVSQMESPRPPPRQRAPSADRAVSHPAAGGERVSTGDDRVDFHRQLARLVRMGSSEHLSSAEHQRKRSREDVRYQSELQDVLWLALQAYLSGDTMHATDQALCLQRAQLPALVQRVLAFRFERQPAAGAEPRCDGCLDVWCRACLDAQRRALSEVSTLMEAVDGAERLYPSGKKLREQQPAFCDAEFRRRLKTLFVWHNLTSQLWMRMRIIRQYLKGMGAGHLPWPELEPTQSPPAPSPSDSVSSREHPPSAAGREVFSPPQDRPPPAAAPVPPPRVKFELSVSESSASANPSDSSSSNTSEGRAMEREPAAAPLHWSVSSTSVCSASETTADGDSKTPYRRCVEKLLKTKGLKKTITKLISHLGSALNQTQAALLPPEEQRGGGSPGAGEVLTSGDASSLGLDDHTAAELREFGEGSVTAAQLALPSFKAVYVWLSLVPLEVTHECVKIRLQQQPKEPSPLSIRQLIAECKEALKAAVLVRGVFVRRMRAIRPQAGAERCVARLDQAVETFDADVKEMLEVYLRYIKQLLLMMQGEIEVSAAQKSLLEEEWTLCKHICPHIAGGEAIAGRNFCFLVSDILPTIGDLLENGIDACIASLQRSSSGDGGREPLYGSRSSTLNTLREFRVLFQEAQDRALKVLLFAKLLRRDLEIAAEFSIQCGAQAILDRLAETGHVRVIAPHSQDHIIFIPGSICMERQYVWQLLDMTLSRQDSRRPVDVGYLVLMACDDCGDVEQLWRGTTIHLEPTAETTITLSYVEVKGLLLVVNNTSHLARAREPFQRAMGACLTLERDETPPNRAITDALEELKEEALKLRLVVADSVALVEEKCSAILADPGATSLAARCREVVQQCFKFAFEYHRELVRLITGSRRPEVAPALISVARQWMRYVVEYCPRGQGLRPRWAKDGFDFVSLCTEPQHTLHLEEEEFKTLQREVTHCMRHIKGLAWSVSSSPLGTAAAAAAVGSRSSSPSDPSRPLYRSSRSLPPPGETPRPDARTAVGVPAELHSPTASRRDSADRPLGELGSPVGSAPSLTPGSPVVSRAAGLGHRTGSVSPSRLSLDGLSLVSPLERARLAVLELDERRDEALRDHRRIGHVSERRADRVHIKAKTVGFTWQMGFLIGQGRFGRVYTAVNNKTGDLMAMKEIHLQPNDHRTIRSVAEELKILEGINHRHLVKYFGVEIHREEMFIFMEFCGEGTLESLSASVDCGLPEHLIRRYTKQLLSAITCLHDHHIIHRDIKGANIFLTDECRCLKLGDFGCSVKIVAHTTMQGEVKGLVGTPAFMAPEVYTSSSGEGQGRAADIWSLACCVVEMATGKRPFPDLEDTYQIMFRVGMGGSPAVPEKLSAEGGHFLELCFVHDPKLRASAQQLDDHPFVKVELDGDEYFSSLPQSLMAGFTRQDYGVT
ncbi:mitogen-activated protein kinase kinase kinase 4-like [Amphibalanus amphitrite]|uniref:mitogen-activated protein kinase kinase kinase 4-like n=1 Tax=Amphibalanus amphitrite TaxID=1232801 RepID=UPI001C917DA4|nr:mitogen-activated protein kinase kinase kinase 4-like [Amphibalanus amphitrite]